MPNTPAETDTGRLAVDFANTRHLHKGAVVDDLSEQGALLRWAERVGLIGPAQALEWSHADPAFLRRLDEQARSLRDVVHRCFDMSTDAQGEAVAALNPWLRRGGVIQQLEGGDARVDLRWVLEAASAQGILTRVALDLAALLANGGLGRVKQCQSPTCILYFLDTSKNASRRWCSMSTCGNREKSTRHRKRQAGD